MGKKAEVGTPKYLANKMKAKGLQKLRWYCQMCQKQCRDENGFKCHTTSESHQRQLLLFADNSRKYIDEFSYDFSKAYLQILRRQFGTKRVLANRVYQEYISDRNHLHMNATRWVTLTGYVKWLGRTGKCAVEETEKGYYITYIDRDPETMEKEDRRNKKIKMDKDDQERTAEYIEQLVQKNAERAAECAQSDTVFTELRRDDSEDGKISLGIKFDESKLPKVTPNAVPLSKLVTTIKRPAPSEDDNDDTASVSSKASTSSSVFKKPKKVAAIEEIMLQQEQRKEKTNRKDYWLAEDIVVKIVTKSLGDDFYKQKAVVKEVKDKYAAVVKVIETCKKVKLDQEHLETVIPAIGKLVLIVNGAYRGERATLLGLDEKRFCVDVEISSGMLMGRKVRDVQYEDICKLNVE